MNIQKPARTQILSVFIFIATTSLLLAAVWSRVSHTYLEDDVLWFFPLITHLAQTSSLPQFLNYVQTSELTFFDSSYFLLGKTLFGYQLWRLTCVSLVIHVANAFLIWILLALVYRFSTATALSAGLIYLSYYAHFHAYLWPMAAHHLITVFFILLFIYLFEIIERRIVSGQRVGRLHWGVIITLSIMVSLLRLSMLIIPLVLIGRILFGSQSMVEARQQYRRWLLVFSILFFYQMTLVLTGSCGDVLSGFLKHISLIGSNHHWVESVIVAIILISLGLAVIDGLLGHKVSCEIKYQRTRPMIFPVWLSIGSSALVSLLLFYWVLACPSAMSCDTVGRWQIMPAIEPMWIRVILWMATSFVLINFVKFCYQVERRMIVFVIWILGVVIFLGVTQKDVPSRYLIYASPFMAVMLSCLIFEILSRKFKAYARIPVMCLSVGLGIIMLMNIYAIYVRCYRTFLADYHWSYDFIKASHLIKDNLAARGIDIHQTRIIVGNVTPLPYLNGWQGGFLKDTHFEPSEPFRYTFYAIAGIPKNLSINTPDQPGSEYFDMNDFIRQPFAVHLLEQLGWPKNDTAGMTQVMFSLYGAVYDGDAKINVIDNILYQESLNIRPAVDDVPPQAVLVEQYRGYDLYYLTSYYFAVQRGHSLHLSFFKGVIPGQALVAKHKYQLRYLIEPSNRIVTIQARSQGKFIKLNMDKMFSYKVRLAGMPIGRLIFHVKDDKWYEGELIYRPPGLIERISSGNAVLIWQTSVDQQFILPLEAEYTSLYRRNKHRPSRVIRYHNNQNFLEGAGYQEDAESANRDIVSLLLWLMLRKYQDGEQISTYFNYSKMFFKFDGNVRANDHLVVISGVVKDIKPTMRSSHHWPIQIQLIEENKIYRVKQINIGGMIRIEE